MKSINQGDLDNDIIIAEKELDQLLDEEKYWRLRARENWLNWGDRNTKWFHSKAFQRNKKNFLDRIKDANGIWVEGDEGIGEVVVQYFKILFSSSRLDPEVINVATKDIKANISEAQNRELEKPFLRREVERALKDMNPSKAPGPDGVHAMFFQSYWDIIGDDISKVCLDILNGEGEIGPLNNTWISLIPKTKNPEKMENYRPISLCNVVYKIISKAFANRMKHILHSVISPSQATFIPRRLIIDNILIGFECIHVINSKRKGKDGYIIMKLDMSKAYDRVEWDYIRKVMEKLGFGNRWVTLVMKRVESVSYAVKINGFPTAEFLSERGIREGDPLSPTCSSYVQRG